MDRASVPIPFPPQLLADWCREDGHEGCAIIIEESPDWMLPTVLRQVARHIEKHDDIRDEDSKILPWILRDEAEARRLQGTPTLSSPGAALTLMSIFALSWFLDGIAP